MNYLEQYYLVSKYLGDFPDIFLLLVPNTILLGNKFV